MRRPPTGLSLAHSICGGFWAAVLQITKRQHIEIRRHQWGWPGAFLNAGPEACVSEKDHAIDYAQNRAYFRSGEIRILDSTGYVERAIPFNKADDEQLTSGFCCLGICGL